MNRRLWPLMAVFCFAPSLWAGGRLFLQFDDAYHGPAVSDSAGGIADIIDLDVLPDGAELHLLVRAEDLDFPVGGFEFQLTFPADWVHLEGSAGEWHRLSPFFVNDAFPRKIPFDVVGAANSETVDNSAGTVRCGAVNLTSQSGVAATGAVTLTRIVFK